MILTRSVQLSCLRGICSSKMSSERYIAVGTPVAGRPPHRSGQARFRHPAPTSGV